MPNTVDDDSNILKNFVGMIATAIEEAIEQSKDAITMPNRDMIYLLEQSRV